jgi:threonine aldolase
MRFLSAQFKTLLKDDLWQDISAHSCTMAKELEKRVRNFDEIEVLYPVQVNSVFAKFPKPWTKELKNNKYFYIWDEKIWSGRWMMSFDSKLDDIIEFENKIKELKEST